MADHDTHSSGREFNVMYYQQQSGNTFKRIKDTYIDAIIENLEQRFNTDEVTILKAFHIFTAAGICRAAKVGPLSEFGINELSTNTDHYGPILTSEEDCSKEYQSYKRVVHANYSGMSFNDLVFVIGAEYSDQFPNLEKLLRISLLIPVSSVPCERGFSTQNRIKFKLRTNLSNHNLNTLCRISEEGPPVDKLD
jgi:hypothetical protein